MARNKSHGYLIVQDSYISFGKDDWVAYLVLIGDLWKVRSPCGTVFGGSWEVRPSIGERENLLVAPDDGKGQKLMELYLGKKYWNTKTRKYKKYQDQYLTLEKGGNNKKSFCHERPKIKKYTIQEIIQNGVNHLMIWF